MDSNLYSSPEGEGAKPPLKPRKWRRFGAVFWVIVAVLFAGWCMVFAAVGHYTIELELIDKGLYP